MSFIQSKLFAAILGSLMFMLTTAFLIPKGIGQAPDATGDDEHGEAKRPAVTRGPSWDFFNPELDQVVSELKMERESMSAREKQLAELEARLKAERVELDEATKRMTKIQQDVNRDVLRIKEDEAGNLKRLAKMYSAMEPAGAAKIMKELDDAVVVKIMTLMKDAETGVILDALGKMGETGTKHAAKISENLRLAVAQNAAQKAAAKP